MPPLVWGMHSFSFQFKNRIRNDLHSQGMDNIHFLRTMSPFLAFVAIQPERIGDRDTGAFYQSHYVDCIKWTNSGWYVGGPI